MCSKFERSILDHESKIKRNKRIRWGIGIAHKGQQKKIRLQKVDALIECTKLGLNKTVCRPQYNMLLLAIAHSFTTQIGMSILVWEILVY